MYKIVFTSKLSSNTPILFQMSSLVRLAVLLTFVGTLVLGNGLQSNEISITGKPTNKVRINQLFTFLIDSTRNTLV